MHYEDLELCKYERGPFHADNWAAPLRAIGWLEHPKPIRRGPTPPQFVWKLRECVEGARTAYGQYGFLGTYTCSICFASGRPSPGPVWSQEMIFVPGIEQVYIAPGGIPHYVEFHAYLPPQLFIDAVMLCPEYGSPAYCEALRIANAGKVPPLERLA